MQYRSRLLNVDGPPEGLIVKEHEALGHESRASCSDFLPPPLLLFHILAQAQQPSQYDSLTAESSEPPG